MANPFIGEIRLFAGNFEPAGWMFCAGQLLAISENDALFALIGTTYGGDGQTTFALPDLRGRVPLHQGLGSGLTARTIGEKAGTETVTLTTNQIPSHTHTMGALSHCGNGAFASPAGRFWAKAAAEKLYGAPGFPSVQMDLGAAKVGNNTGSQAHDNMQPFCGVSFIISLFGVFPSQT